MLPLTRAYGAQLYPAVCITLHWRLTPHNRNTLQVIKPPKDAPLPPKRMQEMQQAAAQARKRAANMRRNAVADRHGVTRIGSADVQSRSESGRGNVGDEVCAGGEAAGGGGGLGTEGGGGEGLRCGTGEGRDESVEVVTMSLQADVCEEGVYLFQVQKRPGRPPKWDAVSCSLSLTLALDAFLLPPVHPLCPFNPSFPALHPVSPVHTSTAARAHTHTHTHTHAHFHMHTHTRRMHPTDIRSRNERPPSEYSVGCVASCQRQTFSIVLLLECVCNTHTRIHTYTHTHTHIHIYTHTHIHTYTTEN